MGSISKIFLGFFSAISTVIVFANPVLNNVASGNVSIQQTPNTTVVNQSSQKAILNWNSFNIGQGQATHFNQPVNGIALNRISPTQGASQIYGVLTATGKIILVNPAGIYFGPSSYVNVGGLIATSGNITNRDFLNGTYKFNQNLNYPGTIVNAGTIIAADHGLVALVGSSVSNTGMIQANLGKVVLASGNAYTMNFAGNDLVNFQIDKGASGGVNNTGTLIADGGQILVTAKSASAVLDNSINVEGVAQAKSVYQHNGEIIIAGDGPVNVKAHINASGRTAGLKGGKVRIAGKKIRVQAPTLIDVSGDFGGGDIIIGMNPLADQTVIDPGVQLLARAETKGDGGFVETSGHDLSVNGISVDTRSNDGKTGTWLLDPWNVTISNAGNNNVSFGSGTYTPSATGANVDVSDLQNNLLTTNVTVTTGNTGAEAGDINVNDSISWATPQKLILSAFHDVNINAGVTITATDSGSSLQLKADNTGTGSGTVTIDPTASLQVAGPVDIFYNPATYLTALPATYVNTGGLLSAFMLINTAANLVTLSGGHAAGASLALTKDIDMSAVAVYAGIGNLNGNEIFDGQGFDINNMNLNSSLIVNVQGFIGILSGGNSTIRNVDFNNMTVTGVVLGTIGAVVGSGSGFIDNVSTSGTLTSTPINGMAGISAIIGFPVNTQVNNAHSSMNIIQTGGAVNGLGGIIGGNGGTVNNSSYTGNIILSNLNAVVGVGGISGSAVGAFANNNNFSSGTISITNSANVSQIGGLAGFGNYTNSHSSMAINISGAATRVGGLLGQEHINLFNSYYTGSINIGGAGTEVGGLAGDGTQINNSYSTGSVTVGSGSQNVGGAVGQGFNFMNTSYSTGTVTAPNSTNVGGFIGANGAGPTIANSYSQSRVNAPGSTNVGGFAGNNPGTLTNVYSTGYVTGGSAVGGLVGLNTGTVNSSYWDVGTSGQFFSAAGTGLNTASLFAQSTYSGWNFGSIWNIDNGKSYPYLRVFYPTGARAISGSTSAGADQSVTLVSGGALLTTAITGANGFYYLLTGLNAISGIDTSIPDNTALLAYLPSSVGNAIGRTTAGNASLNGLDANNSTITLGSSNVNTFTAADLATIKGALVDPNILFSISGNDLILGNASHPNVNLTLTGTTTYTLDGNITPFAGGSSNINLFGPLVLNTNAIISGGTSGTVSIFSSIASTNTLMINNNDLNSVISGVLSNTLGITKTGTGTLTLSNAGNTYSGATNVNAGTLSIASNGALGNTTGVTVAGGANLNINNINYTNPASIVLQNNGTLSGTGNSSINLTSINLNANNNIFASNTLGGLFTINGSFNTAAATLIFQGPGGFSLGNIFNSDTITSSAPITFTGTTVNSANNQSYTQPLSFTNNLVMSGDEIDIASISGTGANNLTLNLNAAFAQSDVGLMSNFANFTKGGAGQLNLNAQNTYTGTTLLGGGGFSNTQLGVNDAIPTTSYLTLIGDLNLNNFNQTVRGLAISSGDIFLGSGTFTIDGNGGGSGYMGGRFFSGTGNVVVTNGFALSMPFNSSYTGSTTITNGASIILLTPSAIPSASFLTISNGGVLDLNSFGQNIDNIAGDGSIVNSGGVLTNFAVHNSAANTFSGSIGGNVFLFKDTGGTLTLSGANSYSGQTFVNGGTLSIANAQGLGNTSSVSVASGATLNFNGVTSANNAPITLTDATLSGTGTSGTGTGTISLNGTLNNITSNTLGNVFDVRGPLAGSANFNVNGPGIVRFSGTGSSFTGALNLNSGTLQMGGNNILPSTLNLVISGGATFDLNNFNTTLGSIAGSGDILLGSGTLTTAGNASTLYSGAISGTGGFTKGGTGTLQLSGNNSYSGITTINNGVLQILTNSALSPNSSNVVINNPGTLLLSSVTVSPTLVTLNGGTLSSTGSSTLTGPIALVAGSNSLINTVSGTFVLNSAIDGAADLTLASGTGSLQVNGNIGSGTPLTSLTTTGANTTISGSVTTSANQTYNNPVILTSNTNYTSTGGVINFNNTLDAIGLDVTLNGSGVNFNNTVGAGGALNSLIVNAANIGINGGLINSATQTYNGLINLGANAILNGSNIAINNGVGGADLTINGTGASNTFYIAGPFSLANIGVNGLGSSNFLTLASAGTQLWSLTGFDSGSISAPGLGGLAFSGIQNIIGGPGSDSFAINGGSLSGVLDGAGGNNSITGDVTDNDWQITGVNAGTVNSLAFINMQNLLGNSMIDKFTVNGGSISGSIDGATGTNTLFADAHDTIWNITGANSGSMSDIAGFSNIQNLTGSTFADEFNFANGGSISGLIDAGAFGSSNSMKWTSYGSIVNVVLSDNKFNATAYNNGNPFATWQNVDYIYGDPSFGNILKLTPQQYTQLVRTGPSSGYIADPLFFFDFNVANLPATFGGIIYPIIEQPWVPQIESLTPSEFPLISNAIKYKQCIQMVSNTNSSSDSSGGFDASFGGRDSGGIDSGGMGSGIGKSRTSVHNGNGSGDFVIKVSCICSYDGRNYKDCDNDKTVVGTDLSKAPRLTSMTSKNY